MTNCICDANKKVDKELKGFINHVPKVKEESITDYLVWKWRELDDRFKYINITEYDRHEESSTTGADFALDLWLVGKKFHYQLLFQAKKFIKPYDGYVGKLNYPEGTQSQLKTLIKYAKSNNKLPFYIIYGKPDSATKTMCTMNQASEFSMFMIDAHTIRDFANSKGKNISLNKILSASNPFHCMFCCPLAEEDSYFSDYFSALAEDPKNEESTDGNEEENDNNKLKPQSNKNLPVYIQLLLDDKTKEMDKKEISAIINQNELEKYKIVGVYDIRDRED